VLTLHAAPHLSPGAQDALYALFDVNMTPLAVGTSMATVEAAKREEMFDRDARYLVLTRERSMPGGMPGGGERENGNGCRSTLAIPSAVRRSASPGTSPTISSPSVSLRAPPVPLEDGPVDIDPAELVGYASFRFDTEETMGPKDVEVVYW
jgi:hypothetical protein